MRSRRKQTAQRPVSATPPALMNCLTALRSQVTKRVVT